MAVLRVICCAGASKECVQQVQEKMKNFSWVTGNLTERVPYWKDESLEEITFEIQCGTRKGKDCWENLFSAMFGGWISIPSRMALDMVHSCSIQEMEKNPKAFFAAMYVSEEEIL